MASLEDVRTLVSVGQLDRLHAVFSAPDRIPCIRTPRSCVVGDEVLCPHSAEYLADHAAQSKQLAVWCFLFDTYIKPHAGDISWQTVCHVVRRGDIEFAAEFETRQPGWSNSIEPVDVYGREPSLSVVKLAMMRGHLAFVKYLVENCDCDVNAGPSGSDLIGAVAKLDIDDGECCILHDVQLERKLIEVDECMRRIQFLVNLGARLDAAAVEAARSVSRSTVIVQFLEASCNIRSDLLEQDAKAGS